jgi:hypothetical protein
MFKLKPSWDDYKTKREQGKSVDDPFTVFRMGLGLDKNAKSLILMVPMEFDPRQRSTRAS